jgi:hypothetical protein
VGRFRINPAAPIDESLVTAGDSASVGLMLIRLLIGFYVVPPQCRTG